MGEESYTPCFLVQIITRATFDKIPDQLTDAIHLIKTRGFKMGIP